MQVVLQEGIPGDDSRRRDGVEIARVSRDARCVVRLSRPEKGHDSLDELAIGLDLQGGLGTAPPDAETSFADHGRVLPSDAEVDFLLHSGVPVEKGPRAAAPKSRIALVTPVLEGDLGLDCAIDDKGSGSGKSGHIQPTSREIDAQGCVLGSPYPLHELGRGNGLKLRRGLRKNKVFGSHL